MTDTELIDSEIAASGGRIQTLESKLAAQGREYPRFFSAAGHVERLREMLSHEAALGALLQGSTAAQASEAANVQLKADLAAANATIVCLQGQVTSLTATPDPIEASRTVHHETELDTAVSASSLREVESYANTDRRRVQPDQFESP